MVRNRLGEGITLELEEPEDPQALAEYRDVLGLLDAEYAALLRKDQEDEMRAMATAVDFLRGRYRQQNRGSK